MTEKKCNLCHKKAVETCIELGKQPVCNRFLQDVSEKEATFTLSFGQCQSCGLAQLTDRFPAEELVPKYEWVIYNEPEKHLDSLAMQMKKLPGLTNESKILGISSKDESLVKRMSTLGFSNTKILSPKEDLNIDNPYAGVESVQLALTSENVSRIVQKDGKFDLIIVRHILEHAYDLNGFMNALNELLSPNGYLVIEVPDCLGVMERNDCAMIWEEHISYFTPIVFKRVFPQFGLELVHFENVPYALENSLVGIGKKGDVNSDILIDEKQLKKEKERADNFAANLKVKRDLVSGYLKGFKKDKTALLGAGHTACCFINFLNLDKHLGCVIDDNPNKKGFFMPGSKLPIYDSKALSEKKMDICLLRLSPSNENKFIEKNKGFIKGGGKFFSILAESDDALPLLTEKGSGVFVAKDPVIKINKKVIDFVKNKASSNIKKRARICFHQDINDPIHEMVIAASKEGHVRVHRHNGKSESFHMIEGEMDVVIFDDDGGVKEIIEMGDYASGKKFYYRLSKDAYHTVVVRSEYAIFHEITNGPFDKKKTVYAPWSPEEDDEKDIADFIKKVDEFKGEN